MFSKFSIVYIGFDVDRIPIVGRYKIIECVQYRRPWYFLSACSELNNRSLIQRELRYLRSKSKSRAPVEVCLIILLVVSQLGMRIPF
jgi:hypothetical protein